MIKVLFVCLGNICRSPMAEAIFDKLLKEKGIRDQFYIESCGTSNFHEGENADPRTLDTLENNNINFSHKARQLSSEDFYKFDYIIAMDEKNYENILEEKLPDTKANIALLLEYKDNTNDKNVPDPYWSGTDGFNKVFNTVEEGCRGFLKHLTDKHEINI